MRTIGEKSWPEHHHLDVRASLNLTNLKHDLDRKLDEALEDTFPASDAVSIIMCAPSS
jgi:hypothetical protein